MEGGKRIVRVGIEKSTYDIFVATAKVSISVEVSRTSSSVGTEDYFGVKSVGRGVDFVYDSLL
jgi:hypothetical protein